MTIDQVIAARKLRFRNEIAAILELLKVQGLEPSTDVQIHVDYHVGWHAVVGVNEQIYTYKFEHRTGSLMLDINH
jgi:hypothetical protein